MKRGWGAAIAVSVLVQCGGGTLLDHVPNLNGSWTGNNVRYGLIYNGVIVTQRLGDSSFTGIGAWATRSHDDTLRVTGVLSGRTVRMTLEYDSSGTARRTSFTGVVSFTTLATMNGLEVFSTDSTDSLYMLRCDRCGTDFPEFGRFPW